MEVKTASHVNPADPSQKVSVCQIKYDSGEQYWAAEFTSPEGTSTRIFSKQEWWTNRIDTATKAAEISFLCDLAYGDVCTSELDYQKMGTTDRWLFVWPEFFPTVDLVRSENPEAPKWHVAWRYVDKSDDAQK